MFGIMTQIKSYGVPFTNAVGNILPVHTHDMTAPVQKTIGNFFNPAHAITEPIREKIEVVPKFKIDSNLIIGLIAIVLALITMKKVKI
jgi:hypothetical protein